VRRTLAALCGPAFRFDHEMIAFVEKHQPETLGDIADYWLARQAKR
jgi:hypothetical protein